MTDAFAPLVRRYRDAHSPTLDINWALLRLLDRPLCEQLTTDLRSEGGPWEVHVATERTWEVVPEEPGLYAFLWRPPFAFDVAENKRPGDLAQVLYVGKAGASDSGQPTTGNLRQRYKEYVKYVRGDPEVLWKGNEPRTRVQLLGRYLTLRPLEYWFTVVPRHSEIPHLEDRLIKLLNPPCNLQRLPRLVSLPAERAF